MAVIVAGPAPTARITDEPPRPTLTLTFPTPGPNRELSRILIGMHDYYTGLNPESFRVVAPWS